VLLSVERVSIGKGMYAGTLVLQIFLRFAYIWPFLICMHIIWIGICGHLVRVKLLEELFIFVIA
jgi:hypothetical protein